MLGLSTLTNLDVAVGIDQTVCQLYRPNKKVSGGLVRILNSTNPQQKNQNRESAAEC